MPVYKQIAKQQKRAKRKAEAILSDEEESSGSERDEEGSDDGETTDSDDDSDDDMDLDDGLGGSGAPLGEDDPRPPPKDFPTAQEALEQPVVSTASLVALLKDGENDDVELDEEEAPLVCVFCPNKVLKKGKMTEVHLASKDHKRRLARFKAHIESDSFPAEHLLADARWVASQLDKAVLERLSYQTQVGGKKAGTVKPSPDTPSSAAAPAAAATTPAKPTPSSKTTAGDPFFAASPSATAATPETPSKGAAKGKGKAASAVAGESSPAPSASSSAAAPPTAAALARKAALVAAAEEAGTSVREQVRLQKKERSDKVAEKKRKIKEARKEKNERIKKRKIESGEGVTPHIPSKKPFVEKIRPTDEEIAKRQAWKKARDEAKEAGLPVPPRPVLAYEHGGKVPEKKGKKAPSTPAAKKEPKERVVNEARMAKRKEKKERKKEEKKAGREKEAEKEKEVLPEL